MRNLPVFAALVSLLCAACTPAPPPPPFHRAVTETELGATKVDPQERRRHFQRHLELRQKVGMPFRNDDVMFASADAKAVAFAVPDEISFGRPFWIRVVRATADSPAGSIVGQGRYDAVWGLRLTRDGRRLGYIAGDDRKRMVVIDGKEFGPFYNAEPPVFSDDGARSAVAVGELEDRWYVLVDGARASNYYDHVYGVSLSPDGSRLAFVARIGKERFAVIDGVEQQKYDAIEQKHQGVWFPGSGFEQYTVHSPFTWSADSKRFAYVRRICGSVECREQMNYFSAADDARNRVVIDGAERGMAGVVSPESFEFSVDGSHYFYSLRVAGSTDSVAHLDDRRIDSGVRLEGFADDSPPTKGPAGPNGSYTIAMAVSPKRQVVVTVDGHLPSNGYRDIVSNVVFDSPTTFHYIAYRTDENRNEGAFLLVSEDIRLGPPPKPTP